MITDFSCLQPYWLLFLPIPWLWLHWRIRHPVAWPQIPPVLAMRYPLLGAIQEKKVISNKPFSKAKTGHSDQTMAIALSFMILALAQPVHYGAAVEQGDDSEPVDLILVVDTALSMSLSDYEIQGQVMSRLAMSQLLLKDFINHYSGKRISLVILGGPPALWVPLTTDKAVVQDAVGRITTLLGGRLPDMGATLNLIRDEFIDDHEKVVVLISDGGAQVGAVSPTIAAQELIANDFTLYAIAVGSSEPDASSLDNSSLIYQPVNLSVLQQLVEHGQGRLFHAKNAQVFRDALQLIEKKHRKLLPKKEGLKLTEPWYPLPLAIALLFLLYAVFVRQKSEVQASE